MVKGRPPNPISEEAKNAFIECYLQCGSSRIASQKIGISEKQTKRILNEAGINLRRSKVEEEIIDKLRNLMASSDMTKVEMAQHLGISRTTMKRLCRRLNLKRQTKRRPPPARQSGPMIETMIAKYGEERGRIRYSEYQDKMSKITSGENNPMFGKPSPQGTGNGWKGWYKDHYFRSLREVMFMIEMDEKGIEWKSGESKDYTIPYTINGKPRTYRPDFIAGNILYEIKPIRLHKSPSVVAKKAAADAFCSTRGLEYRLIDIEIDGESIKAAHDRGDIRFDRDYEKRFLEYAA